jgi:hypothetical protein
MRLKLVGQTPGAIKLPALNINALHGVVNDVFIVTKNLKSHLLWHMPHRKSSFNYEMSGF